MGDYSKYIYEFTYGYTTFDYLDQNVSDIHINLSTGKLSICMTIHANHFINILNV